MFRTGRFGVINALAAILPHSQPPLLMLLPRDKIKMDISTTFASISTALTIAKQLKDIDQGFDKATFKLQISDLMIALADVKVDLSEAKTLLAENDKAIEELKQNLTFRSEKTITRNGYTYGIGQDGKNFTLPYCQVCEHEEKYIIIQSTPGYFMACPNCKGSYDPDSVFINPELVDSTS